jgi:sugar/nucleoside kinase (ribokinase family)
VPALPRRPAAAASRPRVVVVGDLVLDAVLAPARPLDTGTDVPGRVALRQGGSAANTARWLAHLGVRTSLVAAVGRDPIGRALVAAMREAGVVPRVARVAGAPTGRIGVLLGPNGERSFVADRGAADALSPDDLEPAWFRSVDAVHLPAYSLLGEPLGLAGRAAVDLGRRDGALVSLDLASIGPLLARGRRAARELVASIAPDVLFATEAEALALIGRYAVEDLLDYSALAVVKRGAQGATLLARGPDGRRLRVEVATTSVVTTDSTGAGDAFDAGFLASYLGARRAGRTGPSVIHRAALAGHRAARRQLIVPRPELALG